MKRGGNTFHATAATGNGKALNLASWLTQPLRESPHAKRTLSGRTHIRGMDPMTSDAHPRVTLSGQYAPYDAK